MFLPTPLPSPTLVATVHHLPSLDVLERDWRALQQRADCSVFLTWLWIGHWLRIVPDPSALRLVTVHAENELVGLGIVCGKRWLGIGPRYLRLHETGDAVIDRLTIEYNGMLSVSGLESAVLAAALDACAGQLGPGGLLTLPGVASTLLQQAWRQPAGVHLNERRIPGRFVDLEALRREGRDHLSYVHGSTRSVLRRTEKRLHELHGDIRVRVATTKAEAAADFDAMVYMHEAHWWTIKGGSTAFGDPRLLAFHLGLIDEGFEQGAVQLVTVTAGSKVVGRLYNLVHRGVVYYYQAGIDYECAEGKGSPGLLLLQRGIELALAAGMRRFELLAGDHRYKRELAHEQVELSWATVERTGALASLRRLRRRTAAPDPA